MPLYKNKNKGGQILVHRPDGMKYSEGTAVFRDFDEELSVAGTQVSLSFRNAVQAFKKEFGRKPHWDCVVVETSITAHHITTRLMEFDE